MPNHMPVSAFDWGGSDTPPGAPAATARAEETPAAAPKQAQLAALERDAFAKGYEQGERAGAEAAGKRGEAMLRRLSDTLSELTTLRATMIRQTEGQIVELALAVARRVGRGGCRVESEMGLVDAGVDAQIQEIARALLGDEQAGARALRRD